ncbi:MarR family winged helix-turn-helix transcriptional regulator [Pseudarthrobacter sp. YAF2]|uniref:MarR family winged helix-turn-helix transcriptional regulator n=1 Tax=Pseudarthrobacter sp. YAF2 TaxID=3233078 RepID=UPI003F9AA348
MPIVTLDDSRIGPAGRLSTAAICQDLGFLLAKLHTLGSVLNNRGLAGVGLKERSYAVVALANSGLEPTQRELAEFLSLDPSQIVSLIDELENRGLVKRAPGKRDRRVKTITATDQGARVLEAARMAAREAELWHLLLSTRKRLPPSRHFWVKPFGAAQPI